jgi:ribosomal protein S18 acetylase RimI-like enzyme
VQRLALADATRIGLSTQADNTRSQRLYHRFGFVRTYQNDYNIFGRWVNEAKSREVGKSGSRDATPYSGLRTQDSGLE